MIRLDQWCTSLAKIFDGLFINNILLHTCIILGICVVQYKVRATYSFVCYGNVIQCAMCVNPNLLFGWLKTFLKLIQCALLKLLQIMLVQYCSTYISDLFVLLFLPLWLGFAAVHEKLFHSDVQVIYSVCWNKNKKTGMLCDQKSIKLHGIALLPTSQLSEDTRLARRQRIVPCEGCCMYAEKFSIDLWKV